MDNININTPYWENDSVPELKNYLQNKKLNAKLINGIFVDGCSKGKIQITKWIIDNFSNNFNLKYEIAFKNAAQSSHENIINYLLKIICEIDCDFNDLFLYCCANNKLEIAREIYKLGFTVIKGLFNAKTKKIRKYGLVTNTIILAYLNELLAAEIINDQFLVLCSNGDLEQIKKFYESKSIFLPYRMHNAYSTLCEVNNDECIKWILSIYLPPGILLVKSLLLMCKHDNFNMVTYINNILQKEKMMSTEMVDAMYNFLVSEGEFDIIIKMHKLNYKITCPNLVIQCIMDIGAINNEEHHSYFKKLYLAYVHIFEKDLKRKHMIFGYGCEFICVDNINWLHKRLKLFSSSSDKLYLKFMKTSCEALNIYVAEWLADLYDEYEITIMEVLNEDDGDDIFVDIYIIHSKLSPEKVLYKKISKNKIPDYLKPQMLNITKFIDKNDEQSDCLVCMEKPVDLIKLKCNHYSCITCLCTWFLNQNQACTYCKEPVIWSESKMVPCNADDIMKNVYESVKVTDAETQEITNKYDDFIKKFNKK